MLCAASSSRGLIHPYLRDLVKKADPGNTAVESHVNAIDFLEFGNLEESAKNDVQFVRDSPLVLKETTITGWVYEVESGKVVLLLSCFLLEENLQSMPWWTVKTSCPIDTPCYRKYLTLYNEHKPIYIRANDKSYCGPVHGLQRISISVVLGYGSTTSLALAMA